MDRFEQRLTLSDPRLAQRYAELKLLLRIRFLIDGADIEFEACFQREAFISGVEEDIHGLKRRNRFSREHRAKMPRHKLAEMYACGLGTDRKQQAVFFEFFSL